tara:strand:+ start:749 stop:2719 length:1971 start_codon:yes stop_codon:yes gene_type:complete
MFSKVLVANRGEIACRIIRTLQKMSIEAIAVYSDADISAVHVRKADHAIRIGGENPSDSYLNIKSIIKACQLGNVDAVHPGYGFLSENFEFVIELNKAGITFIGPESKVIASMGDKIQAKKLAKNAGVSTIPGFLGEIKNANHAKEIAKDIGYPVMIKASSGGGGKGMRIAYNEKDIEEGIERAKSEAVNAFGDERVFIEKLIEDPRHIEIQILADHHNNVIFLGDRECSIQRRHQKVIEEAPSPYIDSSIRNLMGEQSVALAEAVNYTSAGTVEFVVDANKNFYFLEMNTRLQVEHPVTEYVTGIDLVEQMVRISSGEKLNFTQKDIKIKGNAIEARVYAEDPSRGFLPSIGRLSKYIEPEEEEFVRVDSGVLEGDEITRFYDPMISKVICFGESRESALKKMSSALDLYIIRGVQNNLNFLRNIILNKKFKSGLFSTEFISNNWPEGFSSKVFENGHQIDIEILVIAAFLHCKYYLRTELDFVYDFIIFVLNKKIPVKIAYDNNREYIVNVQDQKILLGSDWRPGNSVFKGVLNNKNIVAQVDIMMEGFLITYLGKEYEVCLRSLHIASLEHYMPIKELPDLGNFLLSPMPGLVVKIEVKEGEKVEAGQSLVIVEAMKMENILTHENSGIIKKINVKEGDSLVADQVILEFDKS